MFFSLPVELLKIPQWVENPRKTIKPLVKILPEFFSHPDQYAPALFQQTDEQ
jgi:hypothetical protein